MKFIYLAIVTVLLGVIWRVADVSGPANSGRRPAIPEVPDGAQSIVLVFAKTNAFFAADEHPQEYHGVENSGCAACGIPLLPDIEAPDLKK